jgi:hypothetical protein
MKVTDFLKETLDRLQSTSPEYFVKLRRVCGYMALICLGITFIPEISSFVGFSLVVPEKLLIASEKFWQLNALLFGFTFIPKQDVPTK